MCSNINGALRNNVADRLRGSHVKQLVLVRNDLSSCTFGELLDDFARESNDDMPAELACKQAVKGFFRFLCTASASEIIGKLTSVCDPSLAVLTSDHAIAIRRVAFIASYAALALVARTLTARQPCAPRSFCAPSKACEVLDIVLAVPLNAVLRPTSPQKIVTFEDLFREVLARLRVSTIGRDACE